jgi:hypothetical protein
MIPAWGATYIMTAFICQSFASVCSPATDNRLGELLFAMSLTSKARAEGKLPQLVSQSGRTASEAAPEK